MHRRLCKHVNCSCWHVIGGHSGGSSLPSRQSGEKSHFHLRGMHFCPSAHRKTSGSLQSKLTSCLCPNTAALQHRTSPRDKIKLMIMSWTEKTSLQTEWRTQRHIKVKLEPEVVRHRPRLLRGRRRLILCLRLTVNLIFSALPRLFLSDNWS